MASLLVFGAVLICFYRVSAETAGFVKSPKSQMKLTGGSTELHCEVTGTPIPEVQWWYIEAEDPDDTFTQLFDGARMDRVRINATYVAHATSTVHLANLTLNDSGTYECRASNDPDRNALRKMPRIKWIRSQANILVFEQPVILTNPKEVSNITAEVLTCNLTNPPSAVQGHYWTRNGKVIDETQKTSPALYIEYKLKKSDTQSGGEYACVFRSNPMFQTVIIVKVRPHVVTSKHSEHGNEKDKAMLICESHSFPQVSEWKWYFAGNDMARKLIVDSEKYKIGSSPNKTTLHIYDLDANQDSGNYTCQGKNEVGERSVTILLRVRSRLAALWPFLGIVVEVFVLVVVIFVYEKRRKPEDICDDDSGAAPLKSKTAANDKDKNVRQRKCK